VQNFAKNLKQIPVNSTIFFIKKKPKFEFFKKKILKKLSHFYTWINSQKHIMIFLNLSFFNSQIWLNYLIDDPYLGYITKKRAREKKKSGFFSPKILVKLLLPKSQKKTLDTS